MPKLINSHELAARVHVAERTVRDWCQKGWIPFYLFGSFHRFDFDEVLKALHRPATREANPHVDIRR
jgi:excisionase family DNA binding protein